MSAKDLETPVVVVGVVLQPQRVSDCGESFHACQKSSGLNGMQHGKQ